VSRVALVGVSASGLETILEKCDAGLATGLLLLFRAAWRSMNEIGVGWL